uniref:Uncharacterized protein n=1 Tax=Peromyscus maniculatus bairdii TaxID=230844 RepID=A0A8C8TN39_PERMB
MNKVQSSMFLFWCLLECLLHVCLPYVDELYPFGKAAGLPGSFTLNGRWLTSVFFKIRDAICKSIGNLVFVSFLFCNKLLFFPFLVIIPRRPGLVHVISVSSIAFAVALICGLIISYMIHRLVKAEEKQQLATLYENVEIPLLDEKEVSEGDVQAETDEPHPENEELGKFIGSVIRTKRREHILKKKMKGEQNLPTENPLESSNYADQVESHDNVESHDSMEKDEEEENL